MDAPFARIDTIQILAESVMNRLLKIALGSLVLSGCRIQDGIDGRPDGRGAVVVERAVYSASNIPNSLTLSLDLTVRNRTDESANILLCSITLEKSDGTNGQIAYVLGGNCNGSDPASGNQPTLAPRSDTVLVREYTIPKASVPDGTRLLAEISLSFGSDFSDRGYFKSAFFIPTEH